VPPSDLPDYAPPFTAGSARGDLDGNLWVRTSNVVNGGSVYDVINGKGELIDRVQVPAGRVIAGFGKGGVVYMGVKEGTGVRLEQARRKWTT
jgi:sugar lactone lactonase YvrE